MNGRDMIRPIFLLLSMTRNRLSLPNVSVLDRIKRSLLKRYRYFHLSIHYVHLINNQMKYFWIFISATLLSFSLQAQHSVIQVGNAQSAKAFAENPAKFLGDLRALRGFGSFMNVDKSSKQYDNLVGFYEIGKEGENFLIFFIKAEIVSSEGKVVASSNKSKAMLVPGQKTFPGQNYFPGQIFFPKGTYEKLPKGSYELRWNAVPAAKELQSMISMGKPEVRYRFSK